MVLARCGKSLSGTYDKTVRTFFGPVKVTLSKCPLITGPLDIKFGNVDEEKLDEVSEFFELRYSNPKAFVHKHIIDSSFEKILP